MAKNFANYSVIDSLSIKQNKKHMGSQINSWANQNQYKIGETVLNKYIIIYSQHLLCPFENMPILSAPF